MSLFSNETPVLGEASTVNGKKIENVLYITVPIVAATATNLNLFTAPVAYTIVGASEVHGTAGGTGSTFQFEVIPSGTANGSGTTVLTSAAVLTGTANTVQNVVPGTAAKAKIPAGSRVGLILAGTLTGLVDGLITLALTRS